MDTKQPSKQELEWIIDGLKSGRLKAEATRDNEGNIMYVTIVPTDADPRRAHRDDPRRTRPL
jgi:hypothetical protein